jgi:hypothetical protein
MFERSLALRRALSAADPRNMQARHRLGFLLTRLAWVNREQQPRQAREYAREGIGILQEILVATGDRRARFDLGFGWLQAAFAAEHSGDLPAACSAFRRAHEHLSGDLPKVLGDDTHFVAEAAAGLTRCGQPSGL